MFASLFLREGGIRCLTPQGAVDMPSDPAELQAELAKHLPKGVHCRLWLLEPSLPEAWQEHDWYRHCLHGKPLADSVLVVRKARWPEAPLLAPCRFYWRCAFPPEEHDFRRDLEPFIEAGRLHRLPGRTDLLPPASGSEWFLLAHGEEGELQGIPQTLLASPAATVWLLACDRGGAMRRLARTLLARGAQTVIYATGPLSAPEIASLMRRRLEQPELRPEEVLIGCRELLCRSAPLEVCGAVELDTGPGREAQRATWRHHHGQPARWEIGEDRDSWLRWKDAYEREQLWPETLRLFELEAYLLWLSERHDHTWMKRFLVRHPGLDTPAGLRQHAKAMRRLGAYSAAAFYLRKALDKTPMGPDAYFLHTLALQLATDMDLPCAAQVHMDQSEALRPPERELEEAHKALDWRARILMRLGDWPAARVLLERKRRDAIEIFGKNGLRELAVLLTFSAWHWAAGEEDNQMLDVWAEEALEAIQGKQNIPPMGNDTHLYLLRALACHRWARGLPVEDWLKRALLEGCWHTDPGPAAQGILLCALHQDMEASAIRMAFEALENGRYDLEACTFAALLGDSERLRRYWQKFCRTREQLAAYLPAWKREIGERLEEERQVFFAESQERCQRIVKQGVLPL